MEHQGAKLMRDWKFLACAVSTVAMVAAAPAYAQDTTSAINGQVTNEAGQSVAGARIVVLHVPSGTRVVTTADAAGRFSLSGLRVGGPYAVVVEAKGFANETIDGISLQIGDTFALPVRMSNREIVVSANTTRSRSLVNGSVSTYKASDIADIVSSRRDVRDIMRRDLLSSYNANVGGVSIAGGNIRTQRFSVDGVQMQDSFGLNYGGMPSSRGIVSMEMIDQLTVKAAPFAISEGNFQGGAVNVVLKSGTNTFHGSAFGNFGGADLTGKRTADNVGAVHDVYGVADSKILNFKNYGASLTGPLIKDKLFLALSYEKLTEGAPDPYGVTGSAAPNPVPNLYYDDTTIASGTTLATGGYAFGVGGNPTTLAGLNSLYSAFKTSYGNFPIGDVPTAIAEKDTKYAAKLDWNITSNQRFSLSYIHHENVVPNFYSGSGGGSNSATAPSIQLQSYLYQLTEHTDAFSGQLNSKWTDRLSSEVRLAYKYYRRGQDSYSGTDFAQFNVCMDPTSSALGATSASSASLVCGSGTPSVRLGPDTPRQANQFHNRIYTFQGNLQYRAGAHTIKVEYDHNYSTLYNLFVYNGATAGGPQGLYYFDSFADFKAQQANEVAYTNTTTGSKNDGYVNWGYHVNTTGIQDTWKVQPNLTVNAGLRYDYYTSGDKVQLNSNFTTRYASLYPGLDNTANLDGRSKLQPRIGFNWAPEPDLKIAGGFGLFAGGLSDVFISNNYSNTGAAINSTGAAITSVDIVRLSSGGCLDRTTNTTLSTALCSAALNGVTGSSISPLLAAYQQSNTAVLANAQVNLLDPKFKLPAQWKYNLSFNYRPDLTDAGLGTGWTVRADVLFSDTQQGVRWTDLRAQPLVVNGVTQVAPDGRVRYGANVNGVAPGSNYDIMLTNTDRGISRVVAVGLTKAFKDFDVSASFTRQWVHDVAGVLASSTVSSTYAVPSSDPNSGGDYGRSAFEVSKILRANFNFHHKFFGDLETRFGINWELRSGQPYSVTMNDFSTSGCTSGRSCVFGTVNTTSHLLYVPDFRLTPTGGGLQYGNVIFADQATLTAVQNLVNSTALRGYQGQIAPKNLMTGPSYNKVDLNFSQQLPFVRRSKITAIVGIENFLNLLNRDWGSYQDIGTTAVVRVTCAGVTATQTCANYLYSTYTAPKTTTYVKPSLYTIRAGVRFDF
jgi:hypothetical protein